MCKEVDESSEHTQQNNAPDAPAAPSEPESAHDEGVKLPKPAEPVAQPQNVLVPPARKSVIEKNFSYDELATKPQAELVEVEVGEYDTSDEYYTYTGETYSTE